MKDCPSYDKLTKLESSALSAVRDGLSKAFAVTLCIFELSSPKPKPALRCRVKGSTYIGALGLTSVIQRLDYLRTSKMFSNASVTASSTYFILTSFNFITANSSFPLNSHRYNFKLTFSSRRIIQEVFTRLGTSYSTILSLASHSV